MKNNRTYIEIKNQKRSNVFSILLNILLVLTSICLTLVFVEIYFAYFKEKSPKRYKVYSKKISGQPHMEDVTNFGALPAGPGQVRKIRVLGNQIVGDAIETFENKFRLVPDRQLDKGQKSTIFYGGSYTFGFGVGDRQTLPYLYKRVSNQNNVYSIAHNGWGAHQLMWMVQNNWLEKLIENSESGGTLIYGFIEDHLNRFFHKDISQVQIPFNHRTPTYKVDSSLKFHYAGTFEQAYPLKSRRQKILTSSDLGKDLVFKTVEYKWTKKEKKLFCGYLTQVKEELKKKNFELKVMYFPVAYVPRDLDICLKRNIHVLDYRGKKRFLKNSGNLRLADYDNHPNFGHNWYVSHWLMKDLRPRFEYASK